MERIQFDEVERKFYELKQALNKGLITADEMKKELKDLMIRDDEGNFWMIGGKTGKWYYYDGIKWNEKEPPFPKEKEKEESYQQTQVYLPGDDRYNLDSREGEEIGETDTRLEQPLREDQLKEAEESGEEKAEAADSFSTITYDRGTQDFQAEEEEADFETNGETSYDAEQDQIYELNLKTDQEEETPSSDSTKESHQLEINDVENESASETVEIETEQEETREKTFTIEDATQVKPIITSSEPEEHKYDQEQEIEDKIGPKKMKRKMPGKKKISLEEDELLIRSINLPSLVFFLGGVGIILGIIFGAVFGVFDTLLADFIQKISPMLNDARGKLQGGLIFGGLGGILGFLVFSVIAALSALLYNLVSSIVGGVRFKIRK